MMPSSERRGCGDAGPGAVDADHIAAADSVSVTSPRHSRVETSATNEDVPAGPAS